jgi:hypothetical protein
MRPPSRPGRRPSSFAHIGHMYSHKVTVSNDIAAISVLKFVDDEQREGRRIQTMGQDCGKKMEFVLR